MSTDIERWIPCSCLTSSQCPWSLQGLNWQYSPSQTRIQVPIPWWQLGETRSQRWLQRQGLSLGRQQQLITGQGLGLRDPGAGQLVDLEHEIRVDKWADVWMWNLKERGRRFSMIPTFLTHTETMDSAFVLSLCFLHTPFLAGLLPGPTFYYLRFFEFAVLYICNSLPLNAFRGPFLHLLQALH